MTPDDALTLRDAQPSDRAFLLALYASTRADEFVQVGWPEQMAQAFMKMQFEAQRGDYERRYPGAVCQVVELRQCPVGRLWVARDARSLTVLDISLIAGLRGQGIGTDCLQRVQRDAAAAGLDVALQVVADSPARRLYLRLGFRDVADVGQAGVRQAMAWTPFPRASSALPAHHLKEMHHEQA